MEWQPIETAPRSTWETTVRILVWNEDANCACFGRVIDCGGGEYLASAEGYNGNWKITHWCNIPKSPTK